jgi:integrase
LCEPLL